MQVNIQLKKYVEENGIKQSYISEQTGLSKDVVSNILNLKRKITAEEFLKICYLLKIDPRSFKDIA